MKISVAILLSCLLQLIVLKTEAQQQQIEIRAAMDQFNLEEAGGGLLRIIPHDPDYHYPQGVDRPAIPLFRVSVLVPPGAELENYSFTHDQVVAMKDVQLANAPDAVPISLIENYNPAPRQFNRSWPDVPLTYVSTMIQRGYRWFAFDFSPFAYDSESRELILVNKVILNLEYKVVENGSQILRPDPELARHIQSHMVNPEKMDRFYPEGKGYGPQLKSSENRLDYLIITSEALKPSFKSLLDWKTRKGLKARLITMEEIEETYDEPTVQLKIKRCLNEYYRDYGLTWVLLGGDADVVPVQRCYAYVRIGFDELLQDNSIPTDLFYGCFDKRFDWNSIMDDSIGHPYWDDVDLIPEVYISRIPVASPQQVETFIDKTIRYETDPPLKDFFERILLSGVRFWNNWDGKSDSHHRSENFYSKYVKYIWKGEKVGFYDTGSDLEAGSSYDVTAENLGRQLNAGYGLFHFCGHGNTQYLLMEKGGGFNTDDVLELDHPVSGVILATACHVNAFDSIDPCLSEAFLRNPSGGGVAFFGSSRFGFDNAATSGELGPSFKFNASFTRHLLGESPLAKWKSFGIISALAKKDFIDNGSGGGAYNYLQYSVNPIGDPELPLYASDPSVFDDVRIYRFGDELTINTGGVYDCRICLTSLDLDEGYQVVAEETSFHTFHEIPEAFQVTITSPGYRPYIYQSAGFTFINQFGNLKVNVYPVPARDYLVVDLAEPTAELKLCDLNGRVLIQMEVLRGDHRLDISAYPEGIYLLNIISGSGRMTTRVAKL